MKSDRRSAVAIVGGGASGTILAAQLARRGISSALIDGSGRVGLGVAYSTTEPAHLLNVRAEGMSAWADDADHFARRFEAEGGDARGFAERRLFGRYLRDMLEDAIATGEIEIVDQAAVDARRRPEGWSVSLEDGSVLTADALVLAIGNQEPEPLRAFAGFPDRFIANPWGQAAQAAVRALAATGGGALLIGTGLTMVDVVLSLGAAGHDGRIVAVSRRGQLPRSHADFTPAPIHHDQIPSGDLLALWRWLRSRSATIGWRAAIDGLRPHSQAIWQSLPVEQQRRFMRHARPWWDVHRHRIAPQVGQTLRDMIGQGRLQVVAGRIAGVRGIEGGLDVELRSRGALESHEMRFDYAFNCTGPLHAISRTRDSLLRSLLDAGCIRPDQLGIGIEVDQQSRASAERLWALGPLTKGRFWEIIAVPDIREQAAAVAGDIAMELRR